MSGVFALSIILILAWYAELSARGIQQGIGSVRMNVRHEVGHGCCGWKRRAKGTMRQSVDRSYLTMIPSWLVNSMQLQAKRSTF